MTPITQFLIDIVFVLLLLCVLYFNTLNLAKSIKYRLTTDKKKRKEDAKKRALSLTSTYCDTSGVDEQTITELYQIIEDLKNKAKK